jgi:uncharacterized protein YndB with AHSA1/START domain
MRALIAAASIALPLASIAANDRILRADVTVDAPVADVWTAWTTEAGIRTFFAPAANIEPRVDGAFEILFDPSAPAGKRGAEGLRILVFEPERRLSFTWNAPDDQPAVRAQRTVVTIELKPLDAAHTALRFTQSGWGEGADWDKALAYFEGAWGGFVLPSLIHRFKAGPIDWQKMPTLTPLPSMRRELIER